MSDLTVSAAPDTRRAAATQALSDAVLEWLRANNQIPENRDVVAVDFAVPFTAKWLTSTGRPARRAGTIVPPHGPDLDALGDMVLRRAQALRFSWHDNFSGLTVEDRPTTRHAYLPGCVADHSAEPLDRARCWVKVGYYGATTWSPNALDVFAHQLTTPAGTRSEVRIELSNATTGQRMATDLNLYSAHALAEDVAHAADRLSWAESVR